MTFRSLSAIITYVARRERLSKTSPTCGRSSSGRAPPCQGGGSEFEPRRPLHMGKFSSAGRASALQAEGQRFEPVNFHQCGPVVQLVRTLACHARGRQFEPDSGRHYASVAQSVEQGTENPRVIGSIPIGGTIFLCILRKEYTFYAAVAHLVERHLAKVEVASSSLVGRSRQIVETGSKSRFFTHYGDVAKW